MNIQANVQANIQTNVQSEAPTGHRGTVFDIGYQSYTGAREGRGRSRMAIYKDGFRTALGFGRGGRAKILPWLFLGVLTAIGLVMAIVAGAVNMNGGEGAAERMGLPSHSDYYAITSMILFVFAAVVAPELLCPDKRNGVINLYLVRPLTGSDYIGSRWAAFLTVMLAATLVPQLLLFLGLSMGAAEPLEYLRANWKNVPKFMLSGLAISAFLTSIAMLTASFTTRRAYASVFLVGLFIISSPFTMGLSQEIGGAAGQWISMFTLTNIPLHVNDAIFGKSNPITEEAPAITLGTTILVSWYFAWTLGAAALLWWRYRRLTP